MIKSYLGKKDLFLLELHSSSSREVRARTQGRNMEAGTDAEAEEDAVSWLETLGLLSVLSNSAQDHQPGEALPQ